MDGQVQPRPEKIIRENISKDEVARYYLEVEFSKLFPEVDIKLINTSIESLPEKKLWGLVEAISFTYHLNGVSFKLSREGYAWNEEIWKISDVLYTGMDTNVNKVIFSKEVNGDSIKFKNYLLNYFGTHKDEDPEKLFSYKPSGRNLKYTKLIATSKEGKIAMLDGSHRLTEMLLNGTEEVHILVGHPIGDIPEDNKRIMIGNSTLIMLTLFYKKGNDEVKQAVTVLLKEIINKTLDGRDAAQKYWVDAMRDEEMRKVGESVLEETLQNP